MLRKADDLEGVYGRTMPEEEEQDQEVASAAPHDGPDASGTSQGEPGSAARSGGTGSDATHRDPSPSEPSDTNERADGRATIVEPGGEDLSPRA